MSTAVSEAAPLPRPGPCPELLARPEGAPPAAVAAVQYRCRTAPGPHRSSTGTAAPVQCGRPIELPPIHKPTGQRPLQLPAIAVAKQ
jgi:hypothetical protein